MSEEKITVAFSADYLEFLSARADSEGVTIAELVAQAVQKKHKPPKSKRRIRKTKRNQELEKLRFEEGWTLQAIGDKYDISRERVRQILGNSGYVAHELRNEKIKAAPADVTNGELAEEYDLGTARLGQIRQSWYRVDGDSMLADGCAWEEWAADRLEQLGHEVELQRHGSPFDILVNGQCKVDVKAASSTMPPSQKDKLINPRYRFVTRKSEDKEACDFFIFITKDTEEAFIVPYDDLPMPKENVIFCWPTARPTMSKYLKYHERWDLIK